ncbi:hypothetical protein V1264_010925 [Littorina saxatilis]|uniref:Uncharacterized protein n=1 Tax=Littorina saxatilis TaxID=31220 RepID=A0AAN9GKC3_9CAEN
MASSRSHRTPLSTQQRHRAIGSYYVKQTFLPVGMITSAIRELPRLLHAKKSSFHLNMYQKLTVPLHFVHSGTLFAESILHIDTGVIYDVISAKICDCAQSVARAVKVGVCDCAQSVARAVKVGVCHCGRMLPVFKPGQVCGG